MCHKISDYYKVSTQQLQDTFSERRLYLETSAAIRSEIYLGMKLRITKRSKLSLCGPGCLILKKFDVTEIQSGYFISR